jgi:hypothetical protein
MRKVRPGKAPVYLAARGSPGKSETESAIAFFRQRANRQKPFAFAAYKHVSVKEALNSLFHFKCAYCESSFRAVHPLDIEHYRPKSGYVIRDRLRKPGYYWLAATWTNLLPSCIDCNRPRYQDVGDDDPEVAGKANKFPLRNERSRARRPGDEELEERLLLNPYLDRPGDHLTFMPDGIVRAKLRRSGESEMERRRSKPTPCSAEVSSTSGATGQGRSQRSCTRSRNGAPSFRRPAAHAPSRTCATRSRC